MIQIFSKNYMELYLVENVFGGNVYKHKVGWLWIIQKRKELRRLARIILPYIPEGEDRFEMFYQPPIAKEE